MTRWKFEAIACCCVAMTFWGYYILPEGLSRQWAYYAGQGALLCACGVILRRSAQTFAGAWACVILAVEGAQQAVCGALHVCSSSTGDACVDMIGEQPYQAVLSLSMSWLIVRAIWARRD